MEETLNLQRQEIMTLNEIVNEMKLKWDTNRQDTMLVNEKQFNHKNSILENQQQYQAKNTSEVNQSQSSRRPDTNFEKERVHCSHYKRLYFSSQPNFPYFFSGSQKSLTHPCPHFYIIFVYN
jgi:uncharacterized coiled-coil protein SlyX